MKHLFTITLLIAFAQFGHSQNACDKWNSIKEKSESDFTDIKRLKIYWSKRCACEQGNITGGTWDYTVSLVNDNYDMYHERRNKFPDQYNYSGSIVPDRKISVGECDNSQNAGYNSSGSTQCKTNTFTKQQDPQNFGNDYMLARCQCQEGVPYEEQAKNLETAMQVNLQSMQQHYGNTLGVPVPPLRWEDCYNVRLGQDPTISPGSQKKDSWAPYKDNLINAKAQSLIHDLAANSDDPALKQMSEDFKTLDNTNQAIADYNSFFNLTPSQADIEFQQVMNNAGQAIAGAKFIINKIKQAKNGPPMTADEKKANIFMWDLRRKIKGLYDEMKIIPPYYDASNEELLTKYDDFSNNLYSYDLATVAERRLLIWFFWTPGRQDISEVKKQYEQYLRTDKIVLLKEIDAWQETANVGYSLYLANLDMSFELTQSLLKMKRSAVLRTLGKDDEADVLMKDFNEDMPIGLIIKFMHESFDEGYYDAANFFYPVVKNYFERQETPLSEYRFDIDITNNDPRFHKVIGPMRRTGASNDFSLYRREVVELLALGAYSDLKSNNLGSYKENVSFLKRFVEKEPVGHFGHYNVENQLEAEILTLALEAAYQIELNEYEVSISIIEDIEKRATIVDDHSYSAWVNQLKFTCYVGLNDYEKANEVYKIRFRGGEFYDSNEMKYQKCLLLFNHQLYERALKGLDLLKETDDNPRNELLRSRIEQKLK